MYDMVMGTILSGSYSGETLFTLIGDDAKIEEQATQISEMLINTGMEYYNDLPAVCEDGMVCR